MYVKKTGVRLAAAHFSKVPQQQDKDKTEGKQPAATVAEPKIFSGAYFYDFLAKHQTGVLVAGSIVGVTAISSLLYGIGDFFLHLSSGLAMYYGFSIGIVATSCTAAGAYVVQRSFRIEPESAVWHAMAELKKHKDLTNILGHNISPGEVKTYTYSKSGFGVIGAIPQLMYPKVYLIFHLVGGSSPAVVTAVVTKKGLFKQHCDYLGVDWTAPTGQTLSLTLVGDESAFHMKNAVKDHVQMLSIRSPKFR